MISSARVVAVLLLMLFVHQNFKSQVKVSGFVRDATSGEILPGTSVYVNGGEVGTSANAHGFFSMNLPFGKYKLGASFVGYALSCDSIYLLQDTVLVLRLYPGVVMDEAVVVARQRSGLLSRTKAGYLQLLGVDFSRAGVLLGEPDLMKVLQTLPGIAAGKEGSSEIYVRGGGADQNLLLLDGAPVYNLNHAFGMLSLFNSDAIQQVTVQKGGIEAQYGGRLSSVVDVMVREGNDTKHHGSFTMSPLGGSLLVEGPITREKCSFLLSARRSWADLVLAGATFPGISFYDVNAKFNYKFANHNQLFLSLYIGGDKFYVNSDSEGKKSNFSFGWGNHLASVRWNHLVAPSVFGRFQLHASSYYDNEKFSSQSGGVDNRASRFSRFDELGMRYHLDLHLSSHHRISCGIEPQFRFFQPAEIEQRLGGQDAVQSSGHISLMQVAGYVDHQWRVGAWQFNPGVRLQYSGASAFTHWGVEPRMSLSYLATSFLSIKASAMMTNQPLHAIRRSTMGWPGYFFVPSTERLKPQQAWQMSVGALYQPVSAIRIDVDCWVKKMDNLVAAYDVPASAFASADWEKMVVQGRGKAVGLDLLVDYSGRVFTSRFSYTLSKAMSAFDVYYHGDWFSFDYDRRHDLTLSSSVQLVKNERVSRDVSTSFTFRSGAPFMLPSSQIQGAYPFVGEKAYDYDLSRLDQYDGPNNMRMPDYHRLDVSYQTTLYKKRGSRSWTLGFYNVYNQQNPYLVYNDGKNGYKQMTLFPLMPYVLFKRVF
ncbi:MAG: TonB-dependent receptor [Marinilabiliaceae bacterium]|nr:TonB-dependent receptor [Marinilabiliaceae bacterium]